MEIVPGAGHLLPVEAREEVAAMIVRTERELVMAHALAIEQNASAASQPSASA
jgi:hypothetical protein